ncbi:MAG: VCBS repeat-containing protein [Opitutaceae bacterium]|nr:VCBS repeat-containing protein [Opitutaceae bacterium]
MEAGRNMTAVAADFDQDGSMDVISSYGGKVSLFSGPGQTETVLYELSAPRSAAIHSATFDIDGDGDMDWAGAESKGPAVWLENPGNTTGEWTARIIDSDLGGIHCFLTADVDRDGQTDLIINHFRPDGVLANSIAWFSRPNDVKSAERWDRHIFANGDARGGSHYFGFGDLDGDGWGEIAVGAKGKPFEDGNWFAYWKNPGAEGVAGPWQKVLLAENQPGATNILPGDVNGDGITDLLASRGHGLGVFWFEGPDWVMREIDPEMASPHSLVLIDLDEDGDLDAASCGFESKRLSIYLNDGEGTFARQDLDLAQESYDLRAVDMDGDGDLDLLNAGRATGNVAWYENPLR